MARQEKQESGKVVQSYIGFVLKMKKDEIETLAQLASAPAILIAFAVTWTAIFALLVGGYVLWSVLI
jgi:hypothetical protein